MASPLFHLIMKEKAVDNQTSFLKTTVDHDIAQIQSSISNVHLRLNDKLKLETRQWFSLGWAPKVSVNCCFQMKGGENQFQPSFNFSEFKQKLENFERDKLVNGTMLRYRTLTGRLAVMRTQCMQGLLPMTLQIAAR